MRACKVHRWFGITIIIFSCHMYELKENDNPKSGKCDCGIPKSSSKSTSRIVVNGEDVTPQDKYPWMVRLVKDGNKTFCTATIISQRVILTAAHCLQRSVNDKKTLKNLKNPSKNKEYWLEPSTFSIQFPIKFISTRHEVLKVVPHKDYDPKMISFDIAVIILKKPLPCTDSSRPICLPPKCVNIGCGQKFIVAGWGTSSVMEESFSKTLKQGKLMAIETKQCKLFDVILEKPETVVCMGGRGRQTTCYGDSGGPIMKKRRRVYYQVGICSQHLNYHCDRKEPAIFTHVGHFLPWIKEQLRRYK